MTRFILLTSHDGPQALPPLACIERIRLRSRSDALVLLLRRYTIPDMSPNEPSVEALTAEIRVLQVGSKPVTLSAARQLDLVDASEIRPFGRVRIDPKPAAGLIEVIGSVDGILARSSATSRKVECPGYNTRPYHDYGLPQVVCRRHRNTSAADGAGQRHEWTEYTPSQELYETWVALPLIVLAGLR